MKSSSQSRRGLGRVVAAVLLAAVMAVGVLATAARPALAAGEATMGHLASGANNGNNHFADSGSEAFVLSGDATTAGTVGADFVLASDPAATSTPTTGSSSATTLAARGSSSTSWTATRPGPPSMACPPSRRASAPTSR